MKKIQFLCPYIMFFHSLNEPIKYFVALDLKRDLDECLGLSIWAEPHLP